MQLKRPSEIWGNETVATYMSLGIVLLLFLMMEITYQIIFESTIMVLSHIFYFPVIIVSFLFPKRGVLISTMISAFYLIFVYSFMNPNFYGIVSATMQFYVYVSISVIVSIISEKVKSDRAKFRGIFDYSEGGICVIDSETGKIVEKNRKFAEILVDWGFSESEDNVVSLCGGDLECRDLLNTLKSEGSFENYELEINSDDGRTNYALMSASKVPNENIVMTFTDITGSKISAQKITELNNSLKESNSEANMYIDILTHDINNANTAAQGFAELLYETVTDDDRPYFDKMLLGIKQSSNIISKVVKIKEIHKKMEAPVPYSVDIAIKNAAERLGVKINNTPSELKVLAGSFLDDLFFYIFENSLSYGNSNVCIDVDSEEKEGLVKISIKDNGPGISDSKKSNIFMRFQPEGDSRRGRGLGLPLCWLIAKSYGGDISAEDVTPGNYKDGLKIVLKLKSA